MKIEQIITAIEQFAPAQLQEPWDNSGLQVGDPAMECVGALICVDVSSAIIDEACRRGCNLIVSHHPLIFKGLKHISPGDNRVEHIAYEAIRRGVAIYSAHTSLDSASSGISNRLARMLGALPQGPIEPKDDATTGLGCVALYEDDLSRNEFVGRVRGILPGGSEPIRCSAGTPEQRVKRIAICGGSGGEFIPKAIALGCDTIFTSEVRYHDFVDYGHLIFIVDIGHFESESCAKQIFYEIISEKFANFAVYKSETEQNSINYL